MTDKPAPNAILSVGDPGDDVQMRFRYQGAYAAILSVPLLDSDSDVEEVYCELHEDILIKRKTGKFVGVQVKTRNVDLGPFKAYDEEIVKSIRRFIEHETQFPDHFAGYVFATNAGFWKAKKNSSNIGYLLGLAHQASAKPVFEVCSTLRGFIDSLTTETKTDSKTKAKTTVTVLHATDEVIVSVLCRIKLDNTLPKFTDATKCLMDCLHNLTDYSDLSYQRLSEIAELMIDELVRAASKPTNSGYHYLAIADDAARLAAEAGISAKRVTPALLLEIIEGDPSNHTHFAMSKASGLAIMVEKMIEGGITETNVDNFKDQRTSAYYHFSKWLHRYGSDRALAIADDVKSSVRNECQEAHDDNYSLTEKFGMAMLKDVRSRLKARLSASPSDFLDCKYDHLIGFAAILTEDCKVWWSKLFSVKAGAKDGSA